MLLHQSSAVPNSYPVLIVQQRFVFASVKKDPWCIEDMYQQPDPYFVSTIDGGNSARIAVRSTFAMDSEKSQQQLLLQRHQWSPQRL
jgi:hypothetical protein